MNEGSDRLNNGNENSAKVEIHGTYLVPLLTFSLCKVNCNGSNLHQSNYFLREGSFFNVSGMKKKKKKKKKEKDMVWMAFHSAHHLTAAMLTHYYYYVLLCTMTTTKVYLIS